MPANDEHNLGPQFNRPGYDGAAIGASARNIKKEIPKIKFPSIPGADATPPAVSLKDMINNVLAVRGNADGHRFSSNRMSPDSMSADTAEAYQAHVRRLVPWNNPNPRHQFNDNPRGN
jgi:hypothetical protein